MNDFSTWYCRCEGVGQDSGYVHEESHLMHDMKPFHVKKRKIAFCMEYDMIFVCHCLCIYEGSSPYKRIFLLGIAHTVEGLPFRYRESTGR